MAKMVEIEALDRLTWINRGSRAIVEDGAGLRNLIAKGRVKVIREDVKVKGPVPPTAQEIADLP